MGRRSHTRVLFCSMNQHIVGKLYLKQGQMSFEYDDTWLNMNGTRPISLSIPLQQGTINTPSVYAYFDNLLPDNPHIRKRIVDRLGAKSTNPFDLLSTIGRDCIGALSLSEQPPNQSDNKVTVTGLPESEIANMLAQVPVNNMMGMSDDSDFRISIAGAQDKTAFTYWDNQWCRPHGTTPTTHIFKLPILHHESAGINLSSSVDNEWFCLKVLHHLGLPVAQADIAKFENQKVLIVKRFDRKVTEQGIVRLPQEDMCQALGVISGSKYEEEGGPGAKQIDELLKYSLSPLEDRLNFFKAQLLFWILGAIDGHAKNFSIFLRPDNAYQLTPIYDVLSVYPYLGQRGLEPRKIKMAMKVHSKNTHYRWHEIQGRHWISHYRNMKLPPGFYNELVNQITAELGNAIQQTLAESTPLFDKDIASVISEYTQNQIRKLTDLT